MTNPAEWTDSNPTFSGKHCLEAAGGGTAAGTAVVINPCDNDPYSNNIITGLSSQRWTIAAVGGNLAKITNVKSGLTLDVLNHSTPTGQGWCCSLTPGPRRSSGTRPAR